MYNFHCFFEQAPKIIFLTYNKMNVIQNLAICQNKMRIHINILCHVIRIIAGSYIKKNNFAGNTQLFSQGHVPKALLVPNSAQFLPV